MKVHVEKQVPLVLMEMLAPLDLQKRENKVLLDNVD